MCMNHDIFKSFVQEMYSILKIQLTNTRILIINNQQKLVNHMIYEYDIYRLARTAAFSF